MTATEITTAKQLYEVSADFREFLRIWDDDRRCPFCLPDFLMEHGLHSQAECATWAATEQDREVYWPTFERGERDGWCGPYPTLVEDTTDKRPWFWSCVDNYSYSVSGFVHKSRNVVIVESETPVGAILELMDIWHARKENEETL